MHLTDPITIPDSFEHSRATATALSRFARMAYSSGEDAKERPYANEDWHRATEQYAYAERIQAAHIQAIVCADDTHIVAAFAGTRAAEDWARTLSYSLSPGYGGRVHKGFSESLDEVWPAVLAALYDIGWEERALWFTGHSLGGALALLASWRAETMGLSVKGCVTFGSPPLLNESAASAFPVPLLRVENEGDWVPELSWPQIDETYHHTGDHMHLLRSGAEALARYEPHLASRIDRFARFLDVDDPQPLEYGGILEDHTINEYIRRLHTSTADW